MNVVQKVFLVVILGIASAVEAGTITGNLKLPSPYIQSGDMQVWVRAGSTTTTHQRQILLSITEAQASPGGLISFSLSGLNDGEDYRLYYSCQSFTFPEACEEIVGRAYYLASNQSVFREAQASIFAGDTDHINIELPILLGNTISGSINIPNSQLAPVGGIDLNVILYTVNNPVTTLFVNSFIEEGQPLDNYKAMIPNDGSETWEVAYICDSFANPNGACADYLMAGYFNSLATNSTEELHINAEALPGNDNSSSINLTLLSGYTISGTLSIPTPPTEVGGIQLTMSARDANNAANNATKSITIAKDANSEDFEILIPQENSSEWRIRYDCEQSVTPIECNKYLDTGYFDSDVVGTMTTPNISDGDKLFGGQSYSGIDFSIISGSEISGKIELSDGVAPEGGVSFNVSAVNTSGSGGSTASQFIIEENQSEVSFQLNVDPNASKQWRVGFDCQEVFTLVCLEITDKGYYDATSGNTVEDSNDAVSLAGGMDHPNINLVVESSALGEVEVCMPIKASNDAVVVVCL